MSSIRRMFLIAGLVTAVSWESHAQVGVFGPTLPLTKQDYQDMSVAAKPLLEDDTLPIGTERDWSNAKSGNQGKITLLERFDTVYQGSKLPCRKLKYRVVGKPPSSPYNLKLELCKVADGTWKIY